MNRRILLVTAVHPDLLPPVHQMALAYNQEKYQVDVLSFGYSKSFSKTEKLHGITYKILSIYEGTLIHKLMHHYRFLRTLKQIYSRESETDFCHLFAFCPTSFFHLSKIAGKRKIKVSCLEVYLRSTLLSFDFIFFRYFLKNINQAERVFFPSFERALYLYGRYNLKTKPAVLINAPFVGKQDDKQTGRSDTKIRIIHTGGLNDSRGVLELLKGFKLLGSDKFEVVITNFGADQYSNVLKEYVQKERINNVVFLSTLSREQLIDLQSGAHIGICFIKNSGSIDTDFVAPNKLGEYLKNNLVCIVSNQTYFKIFDDCPFVMTVDISHPYEVQKALLRAKDLFFSAHGQLPIRQFLLKEYTMTQQLLVNDLI